MSSSPFDYVAYGNAILERIEQLGVPRGFAPHVTQFKADHAPLVAATQAVAVAREARDTALAKVGSSDETLDERVLALANVLVGAGLGTRVRPFGGFSNHAPSALVDLPYATEAKEVRNLLAAIEKKKPTGAVKEAVAACLAAVIVVEGALKDLLGPQARYDRALAARDALLPAWQKALKVFKKHAAAAWVDDEATYDAIFAPPDRVQRPVKRRKKKAAPPAGGTDPTEEQGDTLEEAGPEESEAPAAEEEAKESPAPAAAQKPAPAQKPAAPKSAAPKATKGAAPKATKGAAPAAPKSGAAKALKGGAAKGKKVDKAAGDKGGTRKRR